MIVNNWGGRGAIYIELGLSDFEPGLYHRDSDIEIRDQRLARKIRDQEPNSWDFPMQRRVGRTLTHGNLAPFVMTWK